MIKDLEEKMRRFDGKIKRTSNSSVNVVEGRGGIQGFNDIQTARETISDSRLTPKNLEAKQRAVCGSCFRNGNGLGNGGATNIPYDCKLPKEIIYEMIILNGGCDDAIVANSDELKKGRSSSTSNPYHDDPSDLNAGVANFGIHIQ